MQSLFSTHFDYAGFAVVSMVLTGLVHHWLRRRTGTRRTQWIAWALLIPLLAGGWLVTNLAGKREQQRVREMVEGFAPTYAQEIQRMGHADLAADASHDDSRYLEMIEAEKRWQTVNRSVNDI